MNQLDILVVEDKELHQNAARELLKDHLVKIVGNFSDAIGLLSYGIEGDDRMLKPYDVLLTDLFFPYGQNNVLTDQRLSNEPSPLGYPLALHAGNKDVPYIFILSEMNHHDGSLAAAADCFKNVGSARIKVKDSMLRIADIWDARPHLYRLKDGTITSEPGTVRAPSGGITSDGQMIKNWKSALEAIVRP